MWVDDYGGRKLSHMPSHRPVHGGTQQGPLAKVVLAHIRG
jgi:hypothetical protein